MKEVFLNVINQNVNNNKRFFKFVATQLIYHNLTQINVDRKPCVAALQENNLTVLSLSNDVLTYF